MPRSSPKIAIPAVLMVTWSLYWFLVELGRSGSFWHALGVTMAMIVMAQLGFSAGARHRRERNGYSDDK